MIPTMKIKMKITQQKLEGLLENDAITEGMYVRVHGTHLIAGREESVGSDDETEKFDRVRFTHLRSSQYGLSVKRHTGRWERTPFSGTLEEMVEVVQGLMQHLVAKY